ncbi:MAG: TFIIB-type zinc finger domain-containing protein [Clostridiales bacterium]|nr:TFIIB-type zinc finger domain-containing protein [Clostridiales bacterium]
MKAIACEMCGSNDIIKKDGQYVCQHCGTKYSVEEAKKLMIEGTVDVSGSTVKLDQSDELKNLYELARRAKNDNNSENAQKYYDQLLLKDPSSWEANFYSVYYQSMNCKIAQIQSAAIRLSNCEDTVLQLIKDNVSDPQEQKKAVDEMAARIISISRMLYNAAKSHYNGIGDSIRSNYTQEMINNCCAARDICYNFGDYVVKLFGDEYGKDIAVPCWKTGITQHNGVMTYFAQKESNKNVIMDYASKIQKYDSSYQAPTVNTSSGCYVATAVYGSYDCPQVWTLRRYRDYDLASTWYGRTFIRTYYTVSPILVKWFGETKWFKRMWKGKLDRMVADLQKKGYESTPYEDRNW